MLAYQMAGATATLDALGADLGKELLCLMFPVIFTDYGTEFAGPDVFGFSQDGLRSATFYRDSRRSE